MRRPACRGRIRRLLRSQSANVAIMAALSLPLLVGSLALGVDYAYLSYQRRIDQSQVDLGAIQAASHLDDVRGVLEAYAERNGLHLRIMTEADYAQANDVQPADGAVMTFAEGHYDGSSSVPVGQRFVAGTGPYNAVRVRLFRKGMIHFARVFTEPPVIETSGVAGIDGIAAFSIGSRLASLNGGVLNAILNGTLGTNVSLSAMDYKALLDAKTNALAFLDTANTELDLQAATYRDVLDANVTVGQFVKVLAGSSDVSSVARAALSTIGNTASDRRLVPLARLLGVGSLASLAPGTPAGLSAEASVLDMLTAAGAVADGTHQVALDLGANIPGISGARLTLSIGEPPQQSPWFSIGREGTLVRTAQTRLKLAVQVGGTGLLSGMALRLPIYLELAFAEGKISAIECNGGSATDGSVSVEARPGVVEAWIGNVADSDVNAASPTPNVSQATILDAPLVKATAYAHATMSQATPETLEFSAGDISEGTVKSVSTHTLTGPLVSSLVGELDVHVDALGIPLVTPGAVKTAVVTTYSAIAPAVDGALDQILQALGIKVGEADIRVTGLACGHPVLVQ